MLSLKESQVGYLKTKKPCERAFMREGIFIELTEDIAHPICKRIFIASSVIFYVYFQFI